MRPIGVSFLVYEKVKSLLLGELSHVRLLRLNAATVSLFRSRKALAICLAGNCVGAGGSCLGGYPAPPHQLSHLPGRLEWQDRYDRKPTSGTAERKRVDSSGHHAAWHGGAQLHRRILRGRAESRGHCNARSRSMGRPRPSRGGGRQAVRRGWATCCPTSPVPMAC